MTGRKTKNRAGLKARKLGTSLYGASPERPLQDTPDGQIINKLAATVA